MFYMKTRSIHACAHLGWYLLTSIIYIDKASPEQLALRSSWSTYHALSRVVAKAAIRIVQKGFDARTPF